MQSSWSTRLLIAVLLEAVVGSSSIEVTARSEIKLAKCHSQESESQELWFVPSTMMLDFSNNTRFRIVSRMSQICDTLLPFQVEIPSKDETLDNETTTYSIVEESIVAFPKPVARFLSNGILFLDKEYFRPDEYCIQEISSTIVSLKVCDIQCNHQNTPCIPICCSLDKVIHHDGKMDKCFPSGETLYKPTFYKDVHHKLSEDEAAKVKPHFYTHGLACQEGQELNSYPFRRFNNISQSHVRVLKNGKVKVLYPLERRWKILENDFCLSGLFTREEDSIGQTFYYSGQEQDQIAYYCGSFENVEVVAPHFYVPIYFINSLFLFVTGLVYVLLWDKQNVHGWTVLSFVVAMFFMFIFLAGSYLTGIIYQMEHEDFPRTVICPCIGIAAHYFFLATFFWLSVINFDLWCTFRSMAPVSGRSKGLKRFIGYMTFGWGSPILVITIGLSLASKFPDPVTSEVKIPGYGSQSCFLEASVKGVYLYYIIGGLMGINLVFVCLTLFTIYKFKEGTQAVNTSRSNNSQSLSAKLFFKLFVVMGICWIFEVISWWKSAEETIWYWIILDMFNILQSAGVFFIFVCKRKILNQLEQKYPSLKVVIGPLKKLVVSRKPTTRTMAGSSTGHERTQTTAFSLKKLQSSSRRNPNNIGCSKT